MDGVVGVDPAPGGGVDDRLEGGAQVRPQAERKPPVTFRYTTIGRRSRSLPLLSGGASGCSRKVNRLSRTAR